MTASISYTQDNAVAIIRLDDPLTLNALSPDMATALTLALKRANGEARAILLAGSDRAFCSGARLAAGGADDLMAIGLGEHLRTAYNPMMQAIRESAVPVVTAVCGAAAGIGASLAMAGDIIVAGENAYFVQAFRRIGLVPDGGSPSLLTRSVGRVRAMELMLLGEKLPAPQALAWGLITRVVADDTVEGEAMDLARRLADGPTRCLAWIRRLAWEASEKGWAEQLALESELQDKASATADFREGLAAFLEKRPARFTGR